MIANYTDTGMQQKKVAFIVQHCAMENNQLALEKPKLPDTGFKGHGYVEASFSLEQVFIGRS